MAEHRKRVVIESPLKGDFERNRRYALWCQHHSLKNGEAPFTSHLLYTQSLDDEIPEEREIGIQSGLAWGELAELRLFYLDLYMSQGMIRALLAAEALGQRTENRMLPPEMLGAFLRGEYPKATRSFEQQVPREASCTGDQLRRMESGCPEDMMGRYCELPAGHQGYHRKDGVEWA